jgi:threonine/homoserine/homoserine lactone efflux protein
MFYFITSVLLLLFLPGPTNAMLMTSGAAAGIRPSLPLLATEILTYGLVITPLLLLAAALGDWRLEGSLLLKSVAAAVLILNALRMWKSARANVGGTTRLVGHRAVFTVTLFNPKSMVLAFAIFPPIQGIDDGLFKAFGFVAAALMSGAFWILLGKGLTSGRATLPEGAIGRAAAIILCLFACYLGYSAALDAQSILRTA